MSSYLLRDFVFLSHLYIASALPQTPENGNTNNDTVVLPPGASNHGDSDLICQPAQWTDIAAFFLGNYVAHAATVVLDPGSSFAASAIAIISALLFPGAGILRALRAIFTRSVFYKVALEDDLQAAARAGALCTLFAKDQFNPGHAELVKSVNSKYSFLFDLSVHGSCPNTRDPNLRNYDLVKLPQEAKVEPLTQERAPQICCNYNVLKSIIALAQLLYAISTLYNTRGDQLQKFGYAAFGLTVTPYLFMSFMNLIANLIRPDYPTLYLVRSQDMKDWEEAHQATFDGVVGVLLVQYEQTLKAERLESGRPPAGTELFVIQEEGSNRTVDALDRTQVKKSKKLRFTLRTALLSSVAIYLSFVPLAINGAMSRFRPGHSTHAQRSWITVWVVFGAYFGWGVESILTSSKNVSSTFINVLQIAALAAPAIRGVVVVGQEINNCGVCKRL